MNQRSQQLALIYYQDWLVGKFLHLGESRLWEGVK